MANNRNPQVSLFRRVMLAFLGVWFLTPVACLVLLSFTGWRFLPSPEWVSASKGYGVSAGIIGSASYLLACLAAIHASPAGKGFRKVGATLVAPLVGYFISYATPVAFFPMIWSVVAGSQLEQTHIVENVDNRRRRYCDYSMELSDLPFMFNRICNVPLSARAGLVVGDQIVVQGRGTSYGIFADRWRRLK